MIPFVPFCSPLLYGHIKLCFKYLTPCISVGSHAAMLHHAQRVVYYIILIYSNKYGNKTYPLSCIETKSLEYQVKNKITSIVYKLIKEAFTQILSHLACCWIFSTMLGVEWFLMLKVFYRVFCGRSCCGLVPTSFVGLAYNNKSCAPPSSNRIHVEKVAWTLGFFACLRAERFTPMLTVRGNINPCKAKPQLI